MLSYLLLKQSRFAVRYLFLFALIFLLIPITFCQINYGFPELRPPQLRNELNHPKKFNIKDYYRFTGESGNTFYHNKVAFSGCSQHNDDTEKSIRKMYTSRKFYFSWIKVLENTEPIEGGLYKLQDSSVLLIPKVIFRNKLYTEVTYMDIAIDNIELIKVRRRGRVGRGAAIGAVSGFGMGFITGFFLSKDAVYFSQVQAGAILGGLAVIPGVIIGTVIGTIQVKVTLNGSIETYNTKRTELQKYTMKK